MALVIQNLPANAGDIRDTGLIPGQEDPLEEDQPTQVFLPGESPWIVKYPIEMFWSYSCWSELRMTSWNGDR